jgi:hypothetical protein
MVSRQHVSRTTSQSGTPEACGPCNLGDQCSSFARVSLPPPIFKSRHSLQFFLSKVSGRTESGQTPAVRGALENAFANVPRLDDNSFQGERPSE